jgi:anti-sigma factor RsiW
MKCSKCEQNLSALLDGELGESLAAEMRTHLDGCPACATGAAKMQAVLSLVDGLPALTPGADFDEQFRRKLVQARREQRIAAALPRQWAWWWRLRVPALATAAALGTAVVAVTIVGRGPAGPGPASELMLAQNLELLRDYEVVQNLDALEDYDLVANLDSLLQVQP